MLYLTTRNRHDAYTVARVTHGERGADGGLYLPYRMPVFSAQEVAQLKEKSFGACVADVLNTFFSCRLTDREVDYLIGKNAVKFAEPGHRVVAAESWHNEGWDYGWLQQRLAERICPDVPPTGWTRIGVRIAVLTGIFGQLMRMGITDGCSSVDIAVPAGDFEIPMSCWYARQMGLPVGYILCGCNENAAAWDLMHLGNLRTDAITVKTTTPEADCAVPEHLERLICAVLGPEEALHYSEVCRRGGNYQLVGPQLEALRTGMFAAVISKDRLNTLVHSFYRTCGYILGPYTALGYGAMLDYRGKTGENRPCLLLAEKCPSQDATVVCSAMDLTLRQLQEKLNQI